MNVSIGTNGALLSPAKIISLAQAGLNEVSLSIHSHVATRHDELAASKNAFKNLLMAINGCLNNDLKVIINFPVSVHNIEFAPETLKFIGELGVHKIRILRLTPIGKASIPGNFMHVTDELWQDFSVRVQSINMHVTDCTIQGLCPNIAEEGICNIIPIKFIHVGPTGHIYPCCLLNNRRGMEIGHVSEIIDKDWSYSMRSLNTMVRRKYNLKKNPIPCIITKDSTYETRDVCPLYAKRICQI